jgi:predicted RNA methylase
VQVSFRDPDGYVIRSGGRIFRCVLPQAAAEVLDFLASPLAAEQTAAGNLAGTVVLPPGDAPFDVPAGATLLEHSAIPFPNYPYEWAPEMLRSAASLTLHLAEAALRTGWDLKDASPFNVMFDGARPVFLDLLSFARRDPLDPIWRPYAQFAGAFLYPLLANRLAGLRLDEVFLTQREGLDTARLRRLCSPLALLRPPVLGLVTIPSLLGAAAGNGAPSRYRARRTSDAGEARFLLQRLLTGAGRALARIPQPPNRSEAARYMESGHTYNAEELARKETAVTEALDGAAVANVLDIGCNTGYFSLLAARLGKRVVAIDRDPDGIGELWRAASASGANVLPLVIDIGRPPGACGWANGEQPAFLERARGRFDCVLMLALMHHLVVNERVPLATIFDLLAELTTRRVVAEYVDPADAQFRRIVRGREALHRDVTPEAFEAAASRHFRLHARCQLTPTRCLYTFDKEA